MSSLLIGHEHVELTDEGNALLIRSLGFGAGRLEHSNRNVLFIPSLWIDANLPELFPIPYQGDRPTRYADEYRRRVRALLSPDDPGAVRARLAALAGDGPLPEGRPASPLPLRVTDEDDGVPVARLGIPDAEGMAEITVCGPSVEVALTRGMEARLPKDALAFALPVLADPARLVRLVRSGGDPEQEYDRELLRQIDYLDPSGARVLLYRP